MSAAEALPPGISRESVHDELAASTVKHIAANGDLFEPLPFDPRTYKSQQLEVVQLPPSPTNRDEIESLANMAAQPLFAAIKSALKKQTEPRDNALAALRQGEHVFPVTTHSTLVDVAIWSAAWSDFLEGADPDHWQEHNGLVISRGITTIGVFDMSASEILQKGGHVFMSFPRTETISNLELPESIIASNNSRMRQRVHGWIGQRAVSRTLLGRNLNMAWSGKTDVIDYDDDHTPEQITLGGVNKRTIDIVRRGWVLPVALWADDERQEVVLGDLTKVETVLAAQRVQRWQGDALAAILGMPADAVQIEKT